MNVFELCHVSASCLQLRLEMTDVALDAIDVLRDEVVEHARRRQPEHQLRFLRARA